MGAVAVVVGQVVAEAPRPVADVVGVPATPEAQGLMDPVAIAVMERRIDHRKAGLDVAGLAVLPAQVQVAVAAIEGPIGAAPVAAGVATKGDGVGRPGRAEAGEEAPVPAVAAPVRPGLRLMAVGGPRAVELLEAVDAVPEIVPVAIQDAGPVRGLGVIGLREDGAYAA